MTAVATGVLARLRATLPGLTPALGRIAEVALASPHKVLYSTVTELAEAASSSEGSVIRFCKDLGFSGFQDFKLALATDLAASQTAPRARNEPDNLVGEAVRHAQAAVRETGQLLELAAVEGVAARILAADRTDVYGVGASGMIAGYVHYKLLRLGLSVQIFTDPHLAAMSAVSLTEQSVAIGVSSSGSVIDTVAALRTARGTGAFTAALTNRAKSPLTAVSDVVLLASSPESPLTGGSVPSKIGQLLVLEVLFSALLERREGSSAFLQRTAESVVDKSY